MKHKINFHSLMISICFALVGWIIINLCIVKLSLTQFIIIEVVMVILQIFANFVKVKLRLFSQPKSSNSYDK
jgi:hypothetical protein